MCRGCLSSSGARALSKQPPFPLIQANTDRGKPGREALFWVRAANEQMRPNLYLKDRGDSLGGGACQDTLPVSGCSLHCLLVWRVRGSQGLLVCAKHCNLQV